MAIHVNEAAELLMFVALIAASVVVVRYTRRRVKELPEEDKKMGRPLYAYAVGTAFMGLASLANFVAATQLESGSLEYRLGVVYSYAILTLLAPTLISMAALIVLGRTHFIVPVLSASLAIGVLWVARWLGNPLEVRDAAGDVSSVLYIPAVLLFGYILVKARKPTSLGLLFLVISYPLYRLTIWPLSLGPLNLSITVVGLRLLAPAIVAVAFYFRDIGISFELFAYAICYALVAVYLSSIIATPIGDLIQETSLTLVVLAATLGWSTAAYTYGKWRKSRSRPTLALVLFFALSAWSYVLDVMWTIGVLPDIRWYYASVYLSMISLMFFNLSAFFALEWKAPVLLPVAVIVPGILYMSTAYPQDPHLLPYFAVMMALTGTVQLVIPLVLYLYLWQRMRKALLPAASKPLLLAMGAVVLFLAMMTASGISNPIAGVLIFAAYTAWWLAVSGWAEGFTKWWYARTAKPKAPLGGL